MLSIEYMIDGKIIWVIQVEGIDEYSGIPQTEVLGSPERSVIGSPNAQHQTTTRQTVSNEELESSKVATRTRRGTRTRMVEGTDTKKTPATRTTRKRACQEASIKNKMEKDLQADFEADLDQSEVSEKNVLPGNVFIVQFPEKIFVNFLTSDGEKYNVCSFFV